MCTHYTIAPQLVRGFAHVSDGQGAHAPEPRGPPSASLGCKNRNSVALCNLGPILDDYKRQWEAEPTHAHSPLGGPHGKGVQGENRVNGFPPPSRLPAAQKKSPRMRPFLMVFNPSK